MISLLNGFIVDLNRDREHCGARQIISWAVWFRTPVGLHSELESAVEWCKENDMNPDLMIIPVPVALADDGTYEAVSR